jgi:hypothetical protein
MGNGVSRKNAFEIYWPLTPGNLSSAFFEWLRRAVLSSRMLAESFPIFERRPSWHPLLRDHVLTSAAVSASVVRAQLQQSNNHEVHQETIQVYSLWMVKKSTILGCWRQKAFPSFERCQSGHPLLRDHVLARAAVSATAARGAHQAQHQLHQRRRRHGVGTLGGRLTTFQILLWAPAVS